MIFREMEARDIDRCFRVRTSVRENRFSIEELESGGITRESVARMLKTTHKGWVCEVGGDLVGFSMANGETGEFWVIAVLPEYESKGIGKKLMELAIEWFWSLGLPEIWLWTSHDIATRAYHLYRRGGWEDCGIENGRRIMKLRRSDGEPV